jgi:hypothetical protein
MTLMTAFVIVLVLLILILALEIVKQLGQLDGINEPDDGERM